MRYFAWVVLAGLSAAPFAGQNNKLRYVNPLAIEDTRSIADPAIIHRESSPGAISASCPTTTLLISVSRFLSSPGR